MCGEAQVRNLQYLNRDLSKVLLITASADAYHLQPDNAIKARCPALCLRTHAWSLKGCTPPFMEDNEHVCAAACAQLKPWKLDAGDTALLDLLPLLEQIFRTNVADVRAVVRSFEGQDIPSAFRERMLRLQQQQKQQERRAGLYGSLRR
jgi:import inner membrane translocase subunit TIM50